MPIGRRLPRALGTLPPRQREALDMLERLSRIRGGRGTVQTPAGSFLAPPGVELRAGITPAGGIPAASSDGSYQAVDVSDCSFVADGTYAARRQTWESTFPGFNLSQQAVAGSALTLYALLWGIWVCVWEDCPPQSGS